MPAIIQWTVVTGVAVVGAVLLAIYYAGVRRNLS